MPTPAERLATLEAGINELRHDVQAILASLDGGDGMSYDRSVRGRLHKMESTLAGLAYRRSVGLGMLKGWQALILVGCAVATAAAAWYAAVG